MPEPTVRCSVVSASSHGASEFSREGIQTLLAGDGFFWLDLHAPEGADLSVLHEVFGFHPLAIEDSEHFGQRSKIEDYDDVSFIVVYGAAPDEDRLVEVHCFYSTRFLVTVHRDDCPAFEEVRARYAKRHDGLDRPPLVLYHVVQALVDSFFPLLSEFDDQIDELQSELFRDANPRQLQEFFEMKRLLIGLRKAVTPQRDAFARLMNGVVDLPGVERDDERYFRDIYDHLIRVSDLIDSYRDLLTGAMDVYLSTASNRLNSVTKQLAIIATIFLPLSWVTGFFGQNFEWLVEEVGSVEAFVIFGIGSQLVALALLVFYFRSRRWF